MYARFPFLSFPSFSPSGVVLRVIDVEAHLYRVHSCICPTLSDSLIFLQILYTDVDYFSSFFYERRHHVTSDAHVICSRACIVLFLLLLPQTTQTCARRVPGTHAPTSRTRVVNQTGRWCEWVWWTNKILLGKQPGDPLPPPGHLCSDRLVQ